MSTIILGAGIIGVSTAYYLSQSQPPSSIHLVEASPKLFASASGYAGGFLAKDWFSPSTVELGALSFEEHKRLADEYGGKDKWGYSRSTGANYVTGTGSAKTGDDLIDAFHPTRDVSRPGKAGQEDEVPGWLSRIEGDNAEVISVEGSTAQVDPLRLSQFILSQCLERGVQLHQPAKAISVSKKDSNELSSVRVIATDSSKEVDIPCTRIVITAGAWSPQVFATLFPQAKIKLPITPLAGHSLVVRSPRWAKEHEERGCHAVFTTDESGYSPEIFSRTGGELYIAGLNSSSIPLPALPTESKIDEEAIKQLQITSKRLLGLPGKADDLEVLRKGLCFRPVTSRGTPILTRIADKNLGGITTRGGGEGGVFLAAGHGPWGISMSLGTGKVMAEMIQGKETSANIKGLGL